MYRYTRTIDAAIEPVSVAELKNHSRIDYDNDDTLISAYIKAARVYCERYTSRQFITATWRLTIDDFPGVDGVICLRYPPLISVASIEYVDQNGDTQTLNATKYQVDILNEPGRIAPARLESWPITEDETFNPVTILYTAGYGASADDVPQDIRHAITLLAAHWYENREPVLVGTTATPLDFTVKALLSTYRTEWF